MTGHVKFVEHAEEDSKVHEGGIKIEIVDENTVRCIIGFLQSFHKYSLSLTVPLNLAGTFVPSPLQPFSISLDEVHPDGGESTISVNLSIHNLAGTVEDEIIFIKDGVQKVVILRANILGLEEGTPYLKTGLRMVGSIAHTDVSSDTQ